MTGTDLLARQGLVGKDFLAIALEIDAHRPEERDAALAGVEAVLTPFDQPGGALRAVRRVGAPYVESWLEQESRGATGRYFPLFGLFVVVLNIALYRSWRALAAFLLTLAATVAIAVGLADLAGWSFTIVSSLVPLTVLITTTATLVYLHSRYVEPPSVITRPACSATSGTWVTSTSVVWRSRCSWISRSIMPAPFWESRLPVGSSAKMILGSLTRARQMATRCFSPPESLCGNW